MSGRGHGTRTWFITGGTPGGFGMAFAEAALDLGDQVVLTARRPAELDTWAQAHGNRVLVVPLEVTDAAQVQEAVRMAEERYGGIDVLVNNAGRGWYGSIEGTAEADVRAPARPTSPPLPDRPAQGDRAHRGARS